MAQSIVDFFSQKKIKDLIIKLKRYGVTMKEPQPAQLQQRPFEGKTFVFTGELLSLSRKEAQGMVRSRAGNFSSSVSKHTDFVVVGENPGSKLAQARKLGVVIINEEKFKKMMELKYE